MQLEVSKNLSTKYNIALADPRSPHGKVFKMGESYEQGRVEVIKKRVRTEQKMFQTYK